jgi:hypothetical protein
LASSRRDELQTRIEAIEETYEFMLAYAAQGLSTHEASKTGAQLREFLNRCETAIRELADGFAAVLAEEGLDNDAAYTDFLAVLREDAMKSGSAFRLTMAQLSADRQPERIDPCAGDADGHLPPRRGHNTSLGCIHACLTTGGRWAG